MPDQNNDISIEKLLEEGLTHYGQSRFSEAVEVWEKVLELSPENSLALEYLKIANEDIKEPAGDQPGEPSDGVSVTEHLQRGAELLKDRRLEDAHTEFGKAKLKQRDDPLPHGYESLAMAHRIGRYRSVIGDLNGVPKLVQSFDEIKNMDISKEAGFIMSLVDGVIPYEDILTLARMDRLEAMGHLSALIERGVIRADK